jgi:hypothetical protein
MKGLCFKVSEDILAYYFLIRCVTKVNRHFSNLDEISFSIPNDNFCSNNIFAYC